MMEISEFIKIILILLTTKECITWRWRAKYKLKNRKIPFWEIVKYEKPSYLRNVQIHSRFGHYLEITEDGKVRATFNPNSPDSKLYLFFFY